MRSRLLVVAASLGGGGAERVIVTLLRHLDRERFEIHLALVDASGPYLSQVPADVCVHDLRARRARYAFSASSGRFGGFGPRLFSRRWVISILRFGGMGIVAPRESALDQGGQ